MHSHLNLLEHTPGPQASEENCFPASLAQERIWFLEKLEPGSPLYNLAGAVRLQGTLDREALKQSVIEIVRRHEIFRTSFLELEGRLLQKGHNQLRLQFSEKDLRGVSGQTIEE